MSRTAILYIAERCNQQCVFCLEEDSEWSEFVDPSTQQVYDVLERLHGRGGRQITFMGGETFFRKDLPRIISRAKQIGFTLPKHRVRGPGELEITRVEGREIDDAARAGWLYYVAGNNQEEIARKLGVSRQTAQRLVSPTTVAFDQAIIAAETAKWAQVVKASGAKVD